MEKIKKLENCEVLNQNPRILYAEFEEDEERTLFVGYIRKTINETLFLCNKKASGKIKSIFKKSCLERELNPKERIVIGGEIYE